MVTLCCHSVLCCDHSVLERYALDCDMGGGASKGKGASQDAISTGSSGGAFSPSSKAFEQHAQAELRGLRGVERTQRRIEMMSEVVEFDLGAARSLVGAASPAGRRAGGECVCYRPQDSP